MVSIEEALDLISQQEIFHKVEKRPTLEVLGFHLAETIIAPFDLPSFDNSAMDGYAICGYCESYEIIDEVAAGNTSNHSLEKGKAMRIFTGGKTPQQTTAVIMQEKVKVEGSQLIILDEIIEGKNVRRKGAEITKDQVVFESGHPISPASVGMLSSLGIEAISVYQKPTIRIIATGNELKEAGKKIDEGQIYESNTKALALALTAHGFHSAGRKVIVDQLDAIRQGIKDDLQQCDVLLLTGGISVGDYDYVKQALEENGVDEIFYKVFQKPGKPLYFGRKGNKFVFALPGNPASSLTCFYIHVLPLLQRLSGDRETGLPRLSIPLAHDYTMKSDRPAFLKAKLVNQQVEILDGQGSSMILSMAQGNALVFLKGAIDLKKGDLVECILV